MWGLCGGLPLAGAPVVLHKVRPVLLSVREAPIHLQLHLQFSIFMHAVPVGASSCGFSCGSSAWQMPSAALLDGGIVDMYVDHVDMRV